MLSFPDLSRADLDADLNCGHWRDDGDSWRDRCWADASRDLLAALDGLRPITVTSGRWSVDVRPDRVYGFGVRFSAGGTGHFAGEACAHEGTGYSVECFGLVDKVSCIARFADPRFGDDP